MCIHWHSYFSFSCYTAYVSVMVIGLNLGFHAFPFVSLHNENTLKVLQGPSHNISVKFHAVSWNTLVHFLPVAVSRITFLRSLWHCPVPCVGKLPSSQRKEWVPYRTTSSSLISWRSDPIGYYILYYTNNRHIQYITQYTSHILLVYSSVYKHN